MTTARWVGLTSFILLVVALTAPARADAVASTLALASPLNVRAALTADPVQVAVDGTGRVMIVYKGSDADGHVALHSALKVGAAWQDSLLPLPSQAPYPSSIDPGAVVADPHSGAFHMAATHYGKVYYWKRAGGWSQPEVVDPANGGSACDIVLGQDGAPLLITRSTRFALYRKQGASWARTVLPFSMQQSGMPIAYADATGVPRLLGLRRWTPLVASLPNDTDPMVADNWQVQPSEDTELSSSNRLLADVTDTELVIDWPHQLVFATWTKKEKLYVAWAPVGATTDGAWHSVELALPEGAQHPSGKLVSNGRGGVGIAVRTYVDSDPMLTFHWLSGSGPSAAIPILRPGTQTEASVFTSISSGSVNFFIDDAGTAHLGVVGTKRGETPAGFSRLYYATITGGGTATEGPQLGGHGTTEMGREGAPPDFTVRLLKPSPDVTDRVPYRNGVEPRVPVELEVTNNGAQYFGDLKLKLECEGTAATVTIPDPSNHRDPLFLRGQTRHLYLPSLQFSLRPETPAGPQTLTYTYPVGERKIVFGSGLGRKSCTITVDPDNEIEEENEGNNEVEASFVIGDGRSETDREQGESGAAIRGLNDLAIAMPPKLRGNTALLRAGYVQRPTVLDVVVANPRLAAFFRDTPVQILMDGQEMTRETIPLLDRVPNLLTAALGDCIIYDRSHPKPDLSGVVLHVPIDLTTVPEGMHQLRVVVDPEDRFADLHRENNEAQIDFRVRPPGGTLRIRVLDASTGAPVASATAVLTDLWAGRTDGQGLLEIADVPGGAYKAGSVRAERRDIEPRFYEGASAPFSVPSGGDTEVVLRLERPLTVVGRVTDSLTGQSVAEPIGACAMDGDELLSYGGADSEGHYRIPDVPPGQHKIVIGAYGYQTKEVTADLHRTRPGSDECVLDIAMQDGPRGTLRGRVTESGGQGIGGAAVWLQGAPRAAETAADGAYSFERVAAGSGLAIWAMAPSHTTESADVETLTSGATVDVPPIVLRRIVSRFKSLDFNATTYALCERTAEAGEMPSITVSSEFGKFSGALGLTYHTVEGQDEMEADTLILWIEGGAFIGGGVSTEIPLESLVGVSLDTLKVGSAGTLLDAYGKVFSAIEGVNKLAALLQGDVDPSQLHRGDQVVGTYISHTGTDYEQQPFLDVRTSTDIPVAVTFSGGGSTIVRVDEIELKDKNHASKVLRPEWYSPGYAAFRIGSTFDLSDLEVRLKVAVLNDRLSPGVLGNSSRNLITWKPAQTRWLRVEGYAYEITHE